MGTFTSGTAFSFWTSLFQVYRAVRGHFETVPMSPSPKLSLGSISRQLSSKQTLLKVTTLENFPRGMIPKCPLLFETFFVSVRAWIDFYSDLTHLKKRIDKVVVIQPQLLTCLVVRSVLEMT